MEPINGLAQAGDQEGGIVDGRLKRLIEELGAAIHDSISGSERIPEVIAEIKGGGYDVLLVLNATIAIKMQDAELVSLSARTHATVESGFSPQDVQFLKSLHISVNG
jgi:uncharacterized protein (UPF0335 family)